jgi:hypothetical protein
MKFWEEHAPIVANITDINNYGKVTIKFSANVSIYEMKYINSSSIELNLISRESNMTYFKFNFTCIEFVPSQLVLQIAFDNPMYISYEIIDTLEFKVKHNEVF